MNERPPARWAIFGLTSLALTLVGSVLISDDGKPTLAIILVLVGAAGLLAFSLVPKRYRRT